MTFVFEEGEAVDVGPDGEHAFEKVEGDGLTDSGQSEFVFAEGTGIGGGPFVVDGVAYQPFEDTQSGSDWWQYESVGAGGTNAKGLLDAGVDVDSLGHVVYLFLYHKTDTDEYFFGCWTGDPDANNTLSGAVNVKFNGLGTPSISVRDDTGDNYGSSGGDATAEWVYGVDNMDGVLYSLGSSFSADITVEVTGRNNTDEYPGAWCGRGPSDFNTKSLSGAGSTVEVSINV